MSDEVCVHCGGRAEGNYSIHRDGFGDGPEVPLCDGCGSGPEPTCEEIWAGLRGHDQGRGALTSGVDYEALELRTAAMIEADPGVRAFRSFAREVEAAFEASGATCLLCGGKGVTSAGLFPLCPGCVSEPMTVELIRPRGEPIRATAETCTHCGGRAKGSLCLSGCVSASYNPCLEIKVARPSGRLDADQAWAAGLGDTDLAIVVRTGILNGFAVGDEYLAAAREELAGRQAERGIRPGEVVVMSGRRYEYVGDTSTGPEAARVMIPHDEALVRETFLKKYAFPTEVVDYSGTPAARIEYQQHVRAMTTGELERELSLTDVPVVEGELSPGVRREILTCELLHRRQLPLAAEKPIDFDVYNGLKKRGTK